MKSSEWSVVAGIGLSRLSCAKADDPGERTRPEIFARKCLGSGSRRRIAFNRGANPESGARTRTHSEGLAATGHKGKPLNASTFQPITWACRIRSLQNKTQIEIDMFLQILVIKDAPLLKPREIKEREKKNRVNRLGRFNEKASINPNSIP